MKKTIFNKYLVTGMALMLSHIGLAQANNFTDRATAGISFASVSSYQDQGVAPYDMSKTIDGFVDIESRWSFLGNGILKYSLPLDDNNEPLTQIQGLYIWAHRSNDRSSIVTIKAELQSGYQFTIMQERKLPVTTSRLQPVFVPIGNAYSDPIVSIEITGQGNSGEGGSNPHWSSIAEVRYSTSHTPDEGVAVLSPATTYELGCNRFERVLGGYYTGAQYTNTKYHMIDGIVEDLNYWAIDRPLPFEMWLAQGQLISKVKIWMHKSDVRTSTIDITTDDPFLYRPDLAMYNVQLPITPSDEPVVIELTPPISTMHLIFDFYGNSQNSWNSIGEICWE